jgi:hypothetical protein
MKIAEVICAIAFLMIGACGEGSPAAPMGMAGQGGAPVIASADNPGSAGNAAAGSGGSPTLAAAGAVAAGAGGAGSGSAGSGGAGSGGAGTGAAGTGAAAAGQAGGVAAGSGGTGGSTAGGAGGQGEAAGAEAEEDPFGGIFGTPSDACEGLLCVEAADCTDLYPDEATSCKFTKCVDFQCE